MPQLTEKQQVFLQNFLKVNGNRRKINKQNQQIRESYEDYVRRRDKVKETIASIKELKGGESRAISYERALQDSHAKVKAAAETGDETVIKASYKELETVKTDAYKTLEQREKELVQIGKDVAKFRQTLYEAEREGNDDKKTQKMQKLREECSKWLDKHSIDDCGVVWQIYQQAMRATGGPRPDDLLQGLKQLDGQFYELQKRYNALPDDAEEDDDAVEAVANMIRELRKHALIYHRVATKEEHKTGIAQANRLLQRLRTDFPLPGGVTDDDVQLVD